MRVFEASLLLLFESARKWIEINQLSQLELQRALISHRSKPTPCVLVKNLSPCILPQLEPPSDFYSSPRSSQNAPGHLCMYFRSLFLGSDLTAKKRVPQVNVCDGQRSSLAVCVSALHVTFSFISCSLYVATKAEGKQRVSDCRHLSLVDNNAYCERGRINLSQNRHHHRTRRAGSVRARQAASLNSSHYALGTEFSDLGCQRYLSPQNSEYTRQSRVPRAPQYPFSSVCTALSVSGR